MGDDEAREFQLTNCNTSDLLDEKLSMPLLTQDDSHQNDVYLPVYDSPKLVLQWKNISVIVKSKKGYFRKMETLPSKQIISNVSGIALPGSLLGIMGTSGSGKTTLLNTLTLRCQSHLAVQGKVLVNGSPVTPGGMNRISAYVQQNDLFFGKFTVKEQLMFHALLRMDNSFSKALRLQRVDDIIKELGLTQCQDTVIGVPGRIQGISGGERRRLSFATEILSDPPIMLCDEPTSGLDAAMAQQVILLLRKLALKGKTIICTIHQPSSNLYLLFDRIMIMAEGKLAFLGAPGEALSFFSSVNYPCPATCCPADHFIHVLASVEDEKNTVEELCKAFALFEEVRDETRNQQSKLWEDSTWIMSERESTSQCRAFTIVVQFRTIVWRSWLGVIRDTKIIAVKSIAQLVLGLLCGAMYWNQHMDQLGVINVNSFLLMLQILLTAQYIFPTLHNLCEELPLLRQENWKGLYSTGMYVLCKSVAEVAECILFPIIQVLILYSMIGIANDWYKISAACGVMILLANSLVSYGFVISTVNSSLGGAIGLLPTMLGPLMSVSGSFINMRFVPWYIDWVQYLSFYKFGGEALYINQWHDITHIECNLDNSTCPRNGNDILNTLSSKPDNMSVDVIGLLCLIVFYRLLAAVVLHLQIWRKR